MIESGGQSTTSSKTHEAGGASVPLKVTGLPAARYELLIDDKPAATFTAEQLAQGCNLTLVAGPITDQARQVWSLVLEKNYVFFNRWRQVQLLGFPEWARGLELEANRAAEVTRLDAQITQLEAKLNTARQPKPHTFVLKPVAP